jgi:hypothetical protein
MPDHTADSAHANQGNRSPVHLGVLPCGAASNARNCRARWSWHCCLLASTERLGRLRACRALINAGPRKQSPVKLACLPAEREGAVNTRCQETAGLNMALQAREASATGSQSRAERRLKLAS